MDLESIVKEFTANKQEFIKNLIKLSNNKILEYTKDKNTQSPDLIYLTASENCLKQYRRTLDLNYLEISIILRKCAHKTHWTMVKKGLINKNKKFINLV